MEQIVMAFDYTTLDTEARIVVKEATRRIYERNRRIAQDVFDNGNDLSTVRAQLDHGQWLEWLHAEFGWSERTAYNFMAVAEQFKLANFASLRIAASALYLLASPSTPDEARAEALERSEAGERISHTEAKAIVAAHAPAKKPVPPPVRREAEEMDEEPLDAYEAAHVAPVAPTRAATFTPDELMASARACLIRLDCIAAAPFIESLPEGLREDWRHDTIYVRMYAASIAHHEIEWATKHADTITDPELREALRAYITDPATPIRQELEALANRQAAGMFDEADRASLVTLDASLVRLSATLSDAAYHEMAQHLGTLRAGEPPLSDEAIDTLVARITAKIDALRTRKLAGTWTPADDRALDRLDSEIEPLYSVMELDAEDLAGGVNWVRYARPDAPVAPKVVPPTALTPDDLYAQAEKRLSDLFRQANPDFLRLLALGQDIDLTPDDTDETAQEALWESLTNLIGQYTPEMWAWGLRLTETARRAA